MSSTPIELPGAGPAPSPPQGPAPGPGRGADAGYFRRRLVSWLAALAALPAAAFSPVFVLELRSTSRRRLGYFARAGVVLLLLFICGLTLLPSLESAQDSSAISRSQLQNIAPTLSLALVWTLLFLLPIVAAQMTSGAICEERTRRSLSALATCPLRPSQVILSKFAARLTQVLLIAACVFPFLMAIRVFGGVEAGFVIGATCIVGVTTIATASVAMLASVLVTRPAAAAGLATVVMFATMIIPQILFFAVGLGAPGGLGGSLTAIVLQSSPLMAMIMLTAEQLGGGMGMVPPLIMGVPFWAGTVVILLALSGVMLFSATLMLPRVYRNDGVSDSRPPRRGWRLWGARSGAGASAAGAATPASTAADGASPGAPATRIAGTSREIHGNPVLWRELRRSFFRTWLHLIAVVVCLSAFLIWSLIRGWANDEEWYIGIGVILVILFTFQATTGASASIQGEVQARTWHALITTPMSPWSIVLAKVLGATRRTMIVPVLLIVLTLVSTLAGGVNQPILSMILLLPVLVCSAFMLSAMSVMFSAITRRSQLAAGLSLLVAAIWWLGLPIFIAILAELVRMPSSSQGILLPMVASNPIVMAGVILSEANTSGGPTYDLPGLRNMSVATMSAIVLVVCMCSVLVGLALVRFTSSRLFSVSVRRAVA
jgi:ABC-type transport system involved in multi-copper enzyme maturation permease subunit